MKTILYTGILTTFTVILIFGLFHCQKSVENNKIQGMNNTSENNSTAPVSNLSISVVYDNNTYKEGLSEAWGFSCVIRGTEKTILFDTGGDGSILLSNMEKLGINTKEIDLVVLSHIHDDHVGGLSSFLEINSEVTVYVPQSFPESFKDRVRGYGANVIEVQNPLKICENVYSTGELGTSIIEQSLIIHTDEGSIVITGCAHPGIVKIVEKAKQVVKDKVLFVMGGFHLLNDSSEKIQEVVMDFKKLGVLNAGPTHCSGDTARQIFEKEYKNNYINIGVGKVITLKDLKAL